MKNQIIASLQFRLSRAVPGIGTLSLGLASLLILASRALFGASAPVELAAFGGVVLAVAIVRSWWCSGPHWTRPGLSNALFTLLIVVALVPGAALRSDSLAKGGDRSNRTPTAQVSVREGRAADQPDVPTEVPVAPSPQSSVRVSAPARVPVDNQSIQTATKPGETGQPGAAPTGTVVPVETAVAPTPVPIIEPAISLTASGNCTISGGYAVRLTMVIYNAPAAVTDVWMIPAPGAAAVPWVPQITLPATITPGTVNWEWTVDAASSPTSLLAPTAVFVHVANMVGDPAAAAYLGVDQQGWVHAVFPALAEPCAPTPATEVTDTDTTEPIADSRSVRATELAGSVTDDEADSRTSNRRQTEANSLDDSPDVTSTEEQEPEPRGRSARAATVRDAGELTGAEASTPGAEVSTPGAASPAPTADTRTRIALLSPNETALPGDTVTYTFRVTNDATESQSVRLSATNTIAGWSATVSALGNTAPMAAPVELAAGEAIDVVVTVNVPDGARANTRNDTTLHADVIGETTPALSGADSGADAPVPTANPAERSLRR